MSEEFGRRLYRALDTGVGLREMLAPTMRAQLGSGPEITGAEWLANVAAFRTGFPGGGHVIEEWIVAGEKLTTRGWYLGTHSGPFAGLAPTGVRVRVAVLHVDHIVHGRLVGHYGLLDMAGLLHQLSAVPR